MAETREHLREDSDPLVMVGRVLAGQTHELTNVLAIVLELSGLLEDYAAPHAETTTGERLTSVAERLRRQAQRGQAMIADLNTLAHAVDHDLVCVDLDTLLSLAKRLVARFSRLKRVDVTWTVADGPFTVETDPYRMLHALIALGEGAVARATPDTAVAITARVDGPRLTAEARISSPLAEPSAHRSQVAPPVIGCDLRWRPDVEPPTFVLTLDSHPGGAP
jgi:C4-dicarboxylate-specific signal transduction histidine kinase